MALNVVKLSGQTHRVVHRGVPSGIPIFITLRSDAYEKNISIDLCSHANYGMRTE